MLERWFTGTDLAIGLAAFLLMWYVLGIQVNPLRLSLCPALLGVLGLLAVPKKTSGPQGAARHV